MIHIYTTYDHIKSFKISLSCFGLNAKCLLLLAEKVILMFTQIVRLKFVDFDIIVKKYTIELLRNHAGFSKYMLLLRCQSFNIISKFRSG